VTNSAIGIMGGTFDPVHYGHLVTAESVRAHYGLQEVVFVPTGMPPHKSPQLVSEAEHRYLMTVLATATNPAFSVSRSEIDRPGPSFTADTVREVRRSRGRQTEVMFITGADAVRQLATWSRLDEIFQYCEVVAASRPGYPFAEFEQEIAQLPRSVRQRIHFLEVPALAISSSDIRHRVAEGMPIRYLVPESVKSYIDKMGLYRVARTSVRRGDLGS